MPSTLARYAGAAMIGVVLLLTLLAAFEVVQFADSTLRILLRWAVILLLGWEGVQYVGRHRNNSRSRSDHADDE